MPTFILIHSPLVGPLTWALVAEELSQRGHPTLTPVLPDARHITPPYWQAHAEAVAQSAYAIPADESIAPPMPHNGNRPTPSAGPAPNCRAVTFICSTSRSLSPMLS